VKKHARRPQNKPRGQRKRAPAAPARTAAAVLRAENAALRDQQAATSEILRVISRSPNDVKPVFDTIVHSAKRLLGTLTAAVTRLIGDEIHLAALTMSDESADEEVRGFYPQPVSGSSAQARAVRTLAPVNIGDTETDERLSAAGRKVARARGYRSMLIVPIVHDGTAVGTISLSRPQPGPFTPTEVGLLQTFADQAVIAIENVRLFAEVEARNLALTTALEQKTATSEILRVISSSPTEVQPVFDAIAASATRLCDGLYGLVFRFDGEVITLVADHGSSPERLQVIRRAYPAPPGRASVSAQAILERRVIAIADAQSGTEYPHIAGRAKAVGYRSILSVPMLRGDAAIGAIAVVRVEAVPFTDTQIELLKTFADQAVIAIENVRLFTELESRNRDLTESLDRQTATSEILRVISRAQTDLQPVFDAISRSVVRLFDAHAGTIWLFDGELVSMAAITSSTPEAESRLRATLPERPDPRWARGRAILERSVVQIEDTEDDPSEFNRTLAREFGYRRALVVPMLREGQVVGAVAVTGREPGPYGQRQIELLQTFADQAVIAIENARLLNELQATNRDLTTALDKQTATSDILRVISRSQTDVEPVFQAIMDSAARLLRAQSGALTRIIDGRLVLAAFTATDESGEAALKANFPMSLDSGQLSALTVQARAPFNVADCETDPRLTEAGRRIARARGYRSQAVVPMLRHDEPVGTILLTRGEPGGFSDDEIALLETFADQAVIAIENARLLSELQARTSELTHSVGQLTALGEVGQAVSSSLDVDTVLNTIVGRAVQLAGADGGTLYEYDESAESFELRATTNVDDQVRQLQRTSRLRLGEGAVGVAGQTREPVEIPDIAIEGAYDSRLREALLRAGTRALLAVPLLREERILGGLVVSRRTPGEFAPEVVSVLKTFATQSALAIQNARLFREIEVKSRQLEVASQHKSEFLANMSHELRTPLNAVIGFSEVLLERMFGEVNEKQAEYLGDIHTSAEHLLSLINDILDLSKIEAGRMELDVAEFDLPTAIDNALTLVRERAGRRGIALERAIDDRLGAIRADERKIKQVLLNLLSNALKFTPEGGRVEVRAGIANGTAEISVTDTGIGIAPEDHDAVFEEFRQVGSSEKKAEGTGLGLSLSRKFIELHGGRIWVKSQVGAGSTFTFTLPLKGTV
jgi:GAF domain-containing protein